MQMHVDISMLHMHTQTITIRHHYNRHQQDKGSPDLTRAAVRHSISAYTWTAPIDTKYTHTHIY